MWAWLGWGSVTAAPPVKPDTASTRKKAAGFDDEDLTESFGLSPDGTRIVIASWAQSLSLMTATGPRWRKPSPAPR